MTEVTQAGPWQVALALNSPSFEFEPEGWAEEMAEAGDVSSLRDVRALIEIRAVTSGLVPRALLGGSFGHRDENDLSLRVGWLNGSTARDREGQQGLLGTPLLNGLPEEFAPAVLRGLRQLPELNAPGAIVVRQAGYHPVDSSESAFERAAAVLKWALLNRDGPTLSEHRLRNVLTRLDTLQ